MGISTRFVIWSAIAILASLGAACSSEDELLKEVEVPVSVDPDSVPDDATSLTGRVSDYESGVQIGGAWLSTFPTSEVVKSDDLGRFILVENLVDARLYTVSAEAQGYGVGSAPALATSGKTRNVDLPLIRSDRQLPVLFDPPVIAMTTTVHRTRVAMRSRAEQPLSWEISDAPLWLAIEPLSGELPADGSAELSATLVPESFRQATTLLDPGEVLWGRVELKDSIGRLALLQVLVVPASVGQIELQAALEAEADGRQRVGHPVELVARVRYESTPMQGVALSVDIEGEEGGLVPRDLAPSTSDQGFLALKLDAKLTGHYRIQVGLAAYPSVPRIPLELDVIPDDACGLDNGGCGAPTFNHCSVDEVGAVTCADIDECEATGGYTPCGEVAFWDCVDQVGADPLCTDIDECTSDNGGCGDLLFTTCENRAGLPPLCLDVDECQVVNGHNACGEATFWECTNQEGAPPTCVDLDECQVATDGTNGCGVASFWSCTNLEGAAPSCVDVDECAVATDGTNACGPAAYWDCSNETGTAPTCVDIDECAPGGVCNLTWTVCVNHENSPPTCADVDECLTNNGDCGAPQWYSCSNNPAAPPTCRDIDECAPDSFGFNPCGIATRWTCTNNVAAAPDCVDIDECAADPQGLNACGVSIYWTCANHPGSAPDCVDVDECATDDGGCDTTWSYCRNEVGGMPTCLDINECLVNNGGCGSTQYWSCFDQQGGPPLCDDRDECQPDAAGVNGCGQAQFSVCTNNLAAPPTCEDLDECVVINEANGCGNPSRGWTCVNNLLAAPTCTSCPAGTQNLNNQAGDGCEYSCPPRGETCNQADDDCDGLVDDGFDLLTDPVNCGACGVACGAAANASSVACVGGQCLVEVCGPGFVDRNGNAADGCEAPIAGSLLYVDGTLGSPTGTGGPTDPFDTIQGAVDAALPADGILIRSGVYAEVVTIATADLTIFGEVDGGVLLDIPEGGIGFTVTAGGATLTNLTLLGGRVGIYFDGTAQTILGGQVQHVAVAGQFLPAPTVCDNTVNALPAYGIIATRAQNLEIRDVQIADVTGGRGAAACCNGCGGRVGGQAAGISFDRVNGGAITGVQISSIAGGQGGNGGGCAGIGGASGQGIGIYLLDSVGLSVTDSELRNIDGGAAGNTSGCTGGNGRAASGGYGVYVLRGSAHTLDFNQIEDVTGGKGGASYYSHTSGTGGAAVGLFVSGSTVTGMRGNEIAVIEGGDAGGTAGTGGIVGLKGYGEGVRIDATSNVFLENTAVRQVIPGSGADAGNASCVHSLSSSPVTIDHLSCRDVSPNTAVIGHGVWVTGTTNGVTLTNSIISETNTSCITNADIASAVTVGYSDLWQCGASSSVNIITSGFMYAEDPLFTDQPQGDLHLLPVSPMIDAGSPSSPYPNEPAPDGCRVNVGAYGNTSEAVSAPGANDCG